MSTEIRDLIRRMSLANPLWGAPRIHGELLKLGIEVSQATVGRYLRWRPKDPSPTWRSFLHNHLTDIAAIDMFVVATATFRILYALIILGHDRRKVIHFEVTQNPTQIWLSRQMTEAFPWETAPRYLLRDRDTSYGAAFRDRVKAMGIEEVLTAPRSPWQNPFVERLIGSIRRECLDHVIIFNERHLRHVLSSYFQYHHGPEPICHSTRIVRSLAQSSLPLQARLSPSRRWAVCIIATSVVPPDLRGQRTDARRFRCEGSLHFQPSGSHTTVPRISHSFRTGRKRPRCTDRL
jgi:transposase InsO family protein